MDRKMTVFYSKTDGHIVMIVGDIQDLSVFGPNKNDFASRISYVVVEYDIHVMEDIESYRITNEEVVAI